MLFADKLGMPKKIKDLAESLDLEVTNHHDPEFDAKLCALIFGELTDKYPSYQELIRKIDDQPKTNNNYFNQPSEDVLEENEEHLSNYQITQNELENIDLIGKGIVITGNFSIEREEPEFRKIGDCHMTLVGKKFSLHFSYKWRNKTCH